MAIAFDLLEMAVSMRAERHRRENPEANETEVEAVIHAWLLDRPGAPDGDAVGRAVSWPRDRELRE
jgi:Rv0078B-related antitoxin